MKRVDWKIGNNKKKLNMNKNWEIKRNYNNYKNWEKKKRNWE